MTDKPVPLGGDEMVRTILDVKPEQEALDWICYRVRGGVDPGEERVATAKRPSDDRLWRRPEREDIEKALRRLVSLGMLTYDGGRWSMTPKGYAAI